MTLSTFPEADAVGSARWGSILARYLESTPRIHALGLSIVLALAPVIVVVNLWQPIKPAITIAGGPTMDAASATTLVASLDSWKQQQEIQAQRCDRLFQQHERALSWLPKSLSKATLVDVVQQSLERHQLSSEMIEEPAAIRFEEWTFWETRVRFVGDYGDLCHWLDHWQNSTVPAETLSISVGPSAQQFDSEGSIEAEVRLRFPTRAAATSGGSKTDTEATDTEATDTDALGALT